MTRVAIKSRPEMYLVADIPIRKDADIQAFLSECIQYSEETMSTIDGCLMWIPTVGIRYLGQ